MTSQTLLQAVDLLRRRLDEVETEIASLRTEATEITAALKSLGVEREVVTTEASPTVTRAIVTGGRPGTIRQAVERVFAETPSVVSLDGLVEQLKETHQGDREDEQFRGTIRTALWTLRKEGIIVAAKGKGNHIGVKWLPENASAPESGAEVAVPTSGTGGDSNAELEDHGHDPDRWDREDRGGASVAETPLELSTSNA